MGTLPGKLCVGGTVIPPSHMCLLTPTYLYHLLQRQGARSMELEPHLPQLYTGLDSAGGGPCPQFQQTTRNSLAPVALTVGTRSPPPQTPPPPYRHSTSGATARGDHCRGRILLLDNRGLPAVAVSTRSVSRFQSAGQCQQTHTNWQVQTMPTTRPPTHTQDQQVFSSLLVL